MFGWLFPATCPCSPPAKEWIEERLQWLSEEFDDHAFNGRPIVLPTAEFFPGNYETTWDGVKLLFEHVCGFMDVDPESVHLDLFNSGVGGMVNDKGQLVADTAAGTYSETEYGFVISLNIQEMANLENMVGTIAHELAHLRLLGECRTMSENFDNELLTDLTVVFFGLGIFLANSPRNWESQYSKWPDTDYPRPEYLSPPMYGYALALLAWFRGEDKPTWGKYLRFDPRHDLQQGIRFLNKTKDSTFRPIKYRR